MQDAILIPNAKAYCLRLIHVELVEIVSSDKDLYQRRIADKQKQKTSILRINQRTVRSSCGSQVGGAKLIRANMNQQGF